MEFTPANCRTLFSVTGIEEMGLRKYLRRHSAKEEVDQPEIKDLVFECDERESKWPPGDIPPLPHVARSSTSLKTCLTSSSHRSSTAQSESKTTISQPTLYTTPSEVTIPQNLKEYVAQLVKQELESQSQNMQRYANNVLDSTAGKPAFDSLQTSAFCAPSPNIQGNFPVEYLKPRLLPQIHPVLSSDNAKAEYAGHAVAGCPAGNLIANRTGVETSTLGPQLTSGQVSDSSGFSNSPQTLESLESFDFFDAKTAQSADDDANEDGNDDGKDNLNDDIPRQGDSLVTIEDTGAIETAGEPNESTLVGSNPVPQIENSSNLAAAVAPNGPAPIAHDIPIKAGLNTVPNPTRRLPYPHRLGYANYSGRIPRGMVKSYQPQPAGHGSDNSGLTVRRSNSTDSRSRSQIAVMNSRELPYQLYCRYN